MINIAEWFKNPPKSYPEEIRDVLTAETKDALKSVIVSDYMVYIFPYDNCQEKLGNINILMSCEEDGEESRGSGKDGKGTGKEDGSEEDDRRKEGMTVPIWGWIILPALLVFWIIKTM